MVLLIRIYLNATLRRVQKLGFKNKFPIDGDQKKLFFPDTSLSPEKKTKFLSVRIKQKRIITNYYTYNVKILKRASIDKTKKLKKAEKKLKKSLKFKNYM